MTTDFILNTQRNNNFSIPLNIPSGWMPAVTFRNINAPTNSINDGVLNISITAGEAYKYSGIDFFVEIAKDGVTQRILRGEFSVTSEQDRVAKLSDVRREILQTGGPSDANLVPVNSINYNAEGNISSVNEGGVTTSYTYNSNGSVNTETRNGRVRTWNYDADGNPTGSTVA